MLTPQDRRAKYKAIEQSQRTRIRNLAALITSNGIETLARVLGVSPRLLASLVAGSRRFTPDLTRDFEYSLKLPDGWFDQAIP